MGAHGADHTAVQNDDHICLLHRGYALGNDNFCGAGDLLGKGATDRGVGFGVDRRGGVVQNQDLGLLQQRSCDTQSLLLATGDIGAALLDMGVVLIGEGLDEIIGAG